MHNIQKWEGVERTVQRANRYSHQTWRQPTSFDTSSFGWKENHKSFPIEFQNDWALPSSVNKSSCPHLERVIPSEMQPKLLVGQLASSCFWDDISFGFSRHSVLQSGKKNNLFPGRGHTGNTELETHMIGTLIDTMMDSVRLHVFKKLFQLW